MSTTDTPNTSKADTDDGRVASPQNPDGRVDVTSPVEPTFDDAFFAAVEREVAEGWVRSQRHPTLPLTIYNYTKNTQFEWRWNNVTLACRGLIVDDDNNVVARPLPKFFNLEEVTAVPRRPYRIFEKLDGSLLLACTYDDQLVVATRGSFTSEQSQQGERLLRQAGVDADTLTAAIGPNATLLGEVVYPSNRIVVDYQGRRDVFMLAAIDNDSGAELLPNQIDLPLPTPATYGHDVDDLEQLHQFEVENAEGFVVRFDNRVRVKVKFDRYKQLHRVMTNVTERTIWEATKNGDDVTELLQHLPDEFYDWVRDVQRRLHDEFNTMVERHQQLVDQLKVEGDRKATAHRFLNADADQKLMFYLLDGKNIDELVWRKLKPDPVGPYDDDVWSDSHVGSQTS